MARVNVPGRTVAMMEAVSEILSAPQRKTTRIPTWLPDGTEAKTLGQVATLMRTDVLGAAVYVSEAVQSGAKLDPGITQEALATIKRPDPTDTRGLIKPPPPSDKTGVAVMIPLPLSASYALHYTGGMPPEQMHITIAYYGAPGDADFDFDEESMLDNLRDVAFDWQPFDITLNGITRFSGDDYGDPLVLSVDSPLIDKLRTDVIAGVGEPNMSHGFHPHVSVGYVDKDDPTPGPARMVPIVVHVDTVVLGYEDRYYRVSLGDGRALNEMKDIFHGTGPGGIPLTRTAAVPKSVLRRFRLIRSRLDDRKKRKHKRKMIPITQETKDLHEMMELYGEKVVRHVRTQAGQRRFGQPIGSVIVRDGHGALPGLRSLKPEYEGWETIKGSNGKTYYVGQDDLTGKWVATEGDNWDKIAVSADSEEAVYSGLSRHVQNRVEAAKPAPKAKAPKPKKEPARGGIPQGVRKVRTEAGWADLYDKYKDNNGASIYVDKTPGKNGDYVAYDKDDNELGRSSSQSTAIALAARRLGNHRHEMAPNKPQTVKPQQDEGGMPADLDRVHGLISNASRIYGGEAGRNFSDAAEKLNNAYATDDPDARRSYLEGAQSELNGVLRSPGAIPVKDRPTVQRWRDRIAQELYGKPDRSKPANMRTGKIDQSRLDKITEDINNKPQRELPEYPGKKPKAPTPPKPKIPDITEGDRVPKMRIQERRNYKTTPTAANEALHVWETGRDDGEDVGFEVVGNQVLVHDKQRALEFLGDQRQIHADNADPATNPDAKDRAKAKRRQLAMDKLLDAIRNDEGKPANQKVPDKPTPKPANPNGKLGEATNYRIIKKPKSISDLGRVEYNGKEYDVRFRGGVLADVTVTDENGKTYTEKGGSTLDLNSERGKKRDAALREALRRADEANKKPDVSDDKRKFDLINPADIKPGDTILDWYGGPADQDVASIQKVPLQSYGDTPRYTYVVRNGAGGEHRFGPGQWLKVQRGGAAPKADSNKKPRTREEAAAELYAAQDAVDAAKRGTDEYAEARLRLANARDAYDEVERQRVRGAARAMVADTDQVSKFKPLSHSAAAKTFRPFLEDVRSNEDSFRAVSFYMGEGFYDMNSNLRRGLKTNPTQKKAMEGLDTLLSRHKLERDTYVWRGFGASMNGKMAPGTEFVDHGYTSTTTDKKIADGFAGQVSSGRTRETGRLVKVLLPAGTGAGYLGTINPDDIFFVNPKVESSRAKAVPFNSPANGEDSEYELLVQRNTRYRVLSDDGEVVTIMAIGVENA